MGWGRAEEENPVHSAYYTQNRNRMEEGEWLEGRE